MTLCSVCALTLTAVAHARSAPGAPQEVDGDRSVIVVAVLEQADGEEASRAISTLRAHMSDEVDVVVERPNVQGLRRQIAWARAAAKEHDAAGVFWLDLEPGEELVLYLVEPEGERALVRTIPRDPEGPAPTFEALGAITRSITTAVLDGREIGMSEVEVEAPPVETEAPAPTKPAVAIRTPLPPPPRPTWPRLRVSLTYAGSNLADVVPWQNGVGLDLAVRPVPALVVGAGYVFVIPSPVNDALVSFRVQRNPVRAFVGYHLEASARVAIEVQPYFVVDPVQQRVVEVDPALETPPDTQRVLLGGGGQVVLLWTFARGFALDVGLGVEGVFNPFDYVVVVDQERTTILALHGVRGMATAGFSYGFLARPGKR